MKTKYLYIYITLCVISTNAVNTASAGSTCYDEKNMPSISNVDETKNGIKVTLRGLYAKGRVRDFPVIYWNEEQGWTTDSKDPCISCGMNRIYELQRMIPHIEPIPIEEYEAEEAPSIPAYSDDHIWFGFNFYRGEGSWGTGGVGRYTPATKQLEIHHPVELKRVPVQKVAYDGENLWATTSYRYVCEGNPPALGLVKYNWVNKTIIQFNSVTEGPCGLVPHDLVWKNGSLWVATDIGLSRWIKDKNQWIHYLPDENDYSNVNTVSCPEIYTQLLDKFSTIDALCEETTQCRDVLLDNLKKFRPDYFKR